MADFHDDICDLCNLECAGPVNYSHKPFIFRFYHYDEYKKVLEEFTNNQKISQEELPESDQADISLDEEVSDLEEAIENEEDSSDHGDAVEDEEVSLDDEEISESIGNDKGDEAATEEDEEVFSEDNDQAQNETPKKDRELHNSFSDSAVTTVVADTKTLIGKTLDLTMAAGVGIMAGVVALSSGTENPLSTFSEETKTIFSSTDKIIQTFIGGILAAVAMFGGVKEIMSAVAETEPKLPTCSHCGKPETDIGCIPFCDNCGECEQGTIWRDGDKNKHCLEICHDCVTNCVLCEANVATVKGHHKAFQRNMHGKLTTHLYGTCKNARIVGSSLIIAGIFSCFVPSIGWYLGIPMIAGSVIANSGIRILARPIVKIRCESCNLEEEPEIFQKSVGCQNWCQCCGVQNTGNANEKYCLKLCEECSDD